MFLYLILFDIVLTVGNYCKPIYFSTNHLSPSRVLVVRVVTTPFPPPHNIVGMRSNKRLCHRCYNTKQNTGKRI